ncbi:MAG: Peroxiredoxin [Planctomycetota bacterium]|nr:Peroxiredoxin [Planctomycetota bacterium]
MFLCTGLSRQLSILAACLALAVVEHPRVLNAFEKETAGLSRLSVRLVDGRARPLHAPKGGTLVLVFCSSECPISNGYSPTLNALTSRFPGEKMTMLGLFVDPDLSDEAIGTHAKEYLLTFPSASDRAGRLSKTLGIKVTPEVIVIDDQDRIRYRGRIDDQYAARGKQNANPVSHELRDAIEAVLAGRQVKRPHVPAVGCPLPEPVKEEADRTPK